VGDVGKAGVAIDSVLDMQTLFGGIPLDKVSGSMTMNGRGLAVMAFYICAHLNRAASSRISPHDSERYLKNLCCGNTYIYPPAPSMRIIGDIFTYTSKNMPSLTVFDFGYHMQEAARPHLERLTRSPTDWSTSARALKPD